MPDRFPDGFDTARERVEQVSDRALYRYLQVHICGPYAEDCHAYLTELKNRLREEAFTRAKICTDMPETTPKRLQKDTLSQDEKQELREFWTEASYRFLQNADVAVFLFLDPTHVRDSLPDRAFRDDENPYSDHAADLHDLPQDANGSVLVELGYWLDKMEQPPARTLVLFEESNFDETGSLVSGRVGLEDVHWDTIAAADVSDGFDAVRARCSNWAMNECKFRLQDRYDTDR